MTYLRSFLMLFAHSTQFPVALAFRALASKCSGELFVYCVKFFFSKEGATDKII